MLSIIALLVVSIGADVTEHRISSLYRNKWHYLAHYCACEMADDRSVGNYSVRIRLLRPTQKRSGSVSVNLYDEKAWEKQKVVKDCTEKTQLAFASHELDVLADATWSEVATGHYPVELQGMFFLAISDCSEHLKGIQYDVGRYEMEISNFNGVTNVDYRFQRMYLVQICYLIIIILIVLRYRLSLLHENIRKRFLAISLLLQTLHLLLEILNYRQSSYGLHILSEVLSNLAYAVPIFMLTFIAWGLFLLFEHIPHDEFNLPFLIMFNFLHFMFTLVFNVSHRDPEVYHSLSGHYGYIQMGFRLLICGLGLLGINRSLNSVWSEHKERIPVKYAAAKQAALANVKFIVFQIICMVIVSRQPVCQQHYDLTWAMNFGYVTVIVYLLHLDNGSKVNQHVLIQSEILPI